MPTLVIRTAAVSEQQELENLQWRASMTNDGDRDALLANPDAIELPIEQIERGQVFVAEWNDVVVGFSVVLHGMDGEADLDGLFVDPDARRLGVATELVKSCVTMARAQGSTVLRVTGNPHAQEFYLACGFETVGKIDTRFGIGLLMEKALFSES